MIEFERHKKINMTLDITPVVDCIFILFIFFLLTYSLIDEKRGFEINLPKAKASSYIDAKKMTIFIDKNEKIYLNEQEVTIRQLKGIFENIVRTEPNKLIELHSDEDVRLKIITEVMDMAKICGVMRFSIATLYKPKEETPK